LIEKFKTVIGTSINIEKRRLARFRSAALSLNMSETELLSVLLKKTRKLFGDTAVTKRAVRYQRGYNPDDFEIYHVNFVDVDYEFATGKRYLFKISVSFFISLAIDSFLDEIIYEWTVKKAATAASWEEYLTNFHYKNFEIEHIIETSSEFWVVPWPR